MTAPDRAAYVVPEASSTHDLAAVSRTFFAAWEPSFDVMLTAFEDLMDERCRWDQRPMMVTRSRRQAAVFLKIARATLGLETARVDLLDLAVDNDTVFTRRVDHLRRADGTLIASLPVTGVMRFRGDVVVEWREHFSVVVLVRELLRNLLHRRAAL